MRQLDPVLLESLVAQALLEVPARLSHLEYLVDLAHLEFLGCLEDLVVQFRPVLRPTPLDPEDPVDLLDQYRL